MTNNCVSAQFFSAICVASRSPWRLMRFNVVRSGREQVERDSRCRARRFAYGIATTCEIEGVPPRPSPYPPHGKDDFYYARFLQLINIGLS